MSLPIDLLKGVLDEGKNAPVTTLVVLLTAMGCGLVLYPNLEAVKTDNATQEKSIAAINGQLTVANAQLGRLNESSLRGQLQKAIEQQCRAKPGEAQTYFQNQIDTLNEDYRAVTGHDYQRPPCSIFVQ